MRTCANGANRCSSKSSSPPATPSGAKSSWRQRARGSLHRAHHLRAEKAHAGMELHRDAGPALGGIAPQTPLKVLNPAELGRNQPKSALPQRPGFLLVYREEAENARECGIASHARGRWFEPSRAHRKSPVNTGVFSTHTSLPRACRSRASPRTPSQVASTKALATVPRVVGSDASAQRQTATCRRPR